MSDVGAMVEELIAAGTPPELAARIVAEAFVAGVSSTGHRRTEVDATAERRREWDRERKRKERGQRLPDREWYPLMHEIVKRDGGTCTYCGSGDDLTADHVVPLSRGGSNDRSNLTACCIPCNSKKGNRLVAEWLPAASTVFHPNVHPNPADEKNASLSIQDSLEIKEKKREANRGARLPDKWTPDRSDWAVARELVGEQSARAELEKFRDHWKQQPGSRGVKLDWNAAWRNWARRAAEYRGKGNGKNPQGGGSAIDAWDRLRAKAAGDDRDEGQDAFLLLPPGPIPRS